VLGSAARAINDRVQAPLAICGPSVLAAATLTVQAHRNVELPTGHAKPLSSYFVSVAASGERKNAVDEEASWPVRKREANLRAANGADRLSHANAKEAWDAARKAAINKAIGNRDAIRNVLDALGPTPLPPLVPILTCPEPRMRAYVDCSMRGSPALASSPPKADNLSADMA
jgi:hypothetical protein